MAKKSPKDMTWEEIADACRERGIPFTLSEAEELRKKLASNKRK